MSNLVITGGTGFVGSNLARRLIVDHNVTLIVRLDSYLDNLSDISNELNVFYYNGQIDSLIEFFKKSNTDCVFHLASLFIAEHTSDQIENLIKSNILFGTQLLEAMKEGGVKRIINTGTSWQHYNNEDYNPVCLYAATKQAFETLIDYYHHGEEFSVITLKLFDTYGETDKRPKLINLLKKFANEGTELSMSMGLQKLDLVHIDDVVEAYLISFQKILKNSKPFNLNYGVSSGKHISIRELVSLFESIYGNKLKINWGDRQYRKREVMIPSINHIPLPEWQPKINLQNGLKRIINKND
ncbi:NAD-dependent epimerase/dehydratase family protein [Ekhidna sp.]|uniref:NAD-dependent epimerase/dehydratase family protein n=1 Tax=Ekhidna sp. TaxID=2608089 RepID=UPI003B50FA7A